MKIPHLASSSFSNTEGLVQAMVKIRARVKVGILGLGLELGFKFNICHQSNCHRTNYK